MAWQIGVDVDGTFTDLLALDPERGVFRVAKVLSTPEDQSIGSRTSRSASSPGSPNSKPILPWYRAGPRHDGCHQRKGAVMNAVADAGANINIPATPERVWWELSAHVGGT